MLLLHHCGVALVHVLEHPVQCGVEKSFRPAALRPESHQLWALSEARENCLQKKTKGQMLQSPEGPARALVRMSYYGAQITSGKCKMMDFIWNATWQGC